MRYTVRAAPCEHYQWLVNRTSCARTESFRAIEAVDANGRTGGMVGYDLWTPNSVQMHVCIEDPLAFWAIVRPAFSYPFEEAKLGLVIGVTPGDNAHALAFNKRIGFRETHRIVNGWSPGVDVVIQEMTRAECRWIKRPARSR